MPPFIRRTIPSALVLILLAAVIIGVVVSLSTMQSAEEGLVEPPAISQLQSLSAEECLRVCGEDLSNCPDFAVDDCLPTAIE